LSVTDVMLIGTGAFIHSLGKGARENWKTSTPLRF